MAPNVQTQDDPDFREPKDDYLNGFDPIAVFGFSTNDPFPDEATIKARYHKLVRLIGVIYRADCRLPYTLADVNRARENLLSSYRRTVQVTRGYHKPTWNPAADERDLAALLTPVTAGAPAAATSPSPHPPPNQPVRETHAVSSSETRTQHPSAFPMGASSERPETPTTNANHRGRAAGNDSSSDDDIRILSSRSSVSTRKDPVSELTKQEMRKLAIEQDEERLRSKGANKRKEKDITKGRPQAPENTGGADGDDDVVYLGTGNEIAGYILVGHDRRPGGGGRLMVMCVDCRNHANFYALQPTGRRIGGFRLDRASYDDVDQSPAMLTVLRNIGEIAPAHMSASRQEMKAYYEVMIAQREADARKS